MKNTPLCCKMGIHSVELHVGLCTAALHRLWVSRCPSQSPAAALASETSVRHRKRRSRKRRTRRRRRRRRRRSHLGDIWQPKRQLCANLANRKQDFQNSEQVFSMQIFGADKKSFFILDFKRFWLLIFRNMLRGGTSSTSFKIYELAKLKRCGKVLGQNNLCSSSIKDWAQTHFQKYPHQPWN